MTPPGPAATVAVGLAELRRADAGHAEGVVEAVNSSTSHLAPWLGWAGRRAEVKATALRLALAGAAFGLGGLAEWTMFAAGGSDVVGAAGLYPAAAPGGPPQVGYWVRAGWTGRGVATAAAGSVVAAGFSDLGLAEIELRCDCANLASAGVARRLGFGLVEVVAGERKAPAETGRTMVWRLDRRAWAGPGADGPGPAPARGALG